MTVRVGALSAGFVIRPGDRGVGTEAWVEVEFLDAGSVASDAETYELTLDQAKQLCGLLENMVDRAEHARELIDGVVKS